MQHRQNNVFPASDGISLQQVLPIKGPLVVVQNLIDLPTELKMKILESLPGVAVAMVSGVNREFRDLSSDNNMWKQKCLEEGLCQKDEVTEIESSGDLVDWKAKFGFRWYKKIFDTQLHLLMKEAQRSSFAVAVMKYPLPI